jgi:hypothetical protein
LFFFQGTKGLEPFNTAPHIPNSFFMVKYKYYFMGK